MYYSRFVCTLTLDFEHDSFANRRQHTVRRYAQISAHVEPAHSRNMQYFAVNEINWNNNIIIITTVLYGRKITIQLQYTVVDTFLF